MYALLVHASGAGLNGLTTPNIDTSGASLLVVVLSDYQGATIGTLTDSNNNTWTKLTSHANASLERATIYYCASPIVGSGHNFTYSGTGTFAALAALAFSGASISPFDFENGATAASATSLATGSVTPPEDDCLIIAGLSGLQTATINAGFTISDQVAFSGGVNLNLAAAYLIQTTAGAVNPTFSWTTPDDAAASIAVFKSGPTDDNSSSSSASSLSSLSSSSTSSLSSQSSSSSSSVSSQSSASSNSSSSTSSLSSQSSSSSSSASSASSASSSSSSSSPADLKLGFIGDSIWDLDLSYGGIDIPALIALRLAQTGEIRTVAILNAAESGTKTGDWVPSGGRYQAAKVNFTSLGVKYVPIMLGANDASASVSASDYGDNIGLITADLVSDGRIPILFYPPARSDSGGSFNALLVAYQAEIDALVNGVNILQGDMLAWDWFNAHDQTTDGVHPSEQGADSLAAMQTWAIWNAIFNRRKSQPQYIIGI